jgi:integrase/recombinase XerD
MTSSNSTTPLRQRMIEDMQARKLGRDSQRNHIGACKRFAAWLGRCPSSAIADDVKAFQLHLIESGASICNRNRIMTGVKFLLRVTLRRHDLAAEIYHLREPQKVPVVMSAAEIRRILDMAASVKVRAMLSLSYGCGLRSSEVVRLKVGDIDSDQEIIRIVQAKGRKDRHVMLPDDVLVLLRLWWQERRCRFDANTPPPERHLFPGRGDQHHLTTRQYARLFQETVAAAGIKKPVTLHTMRHSFATHLLEAGVDIRKIQALLGHSKLETTARYAYVATGMIAEIESPLDVLSGNGRKRKSKGRST